MSWLDPVLATLVAVVFILVCSLVPEPERRRFNAILVAGAGSAYLNAGLGAWEFAYTALATWVAYRGLDSYRFIGLAWLMHTGWDVAHHLYGEPIVWCVPTSSAQCAVCDAVLAGWFFGGAQSFLGRSRDRTSSQRT